MLGRMSGSRLAATIALLAIALVTTGCAQKASTGADGSSSLPTVSPSPTIGPVLGPPAPTASPTKPVVHVPKGEPPTKLVIKDLVAGSGAPAASGDQLSVQYVGVAWSTGKQFDASWDRGQPLQFTLGQGNVIKGWDEGLVGMRVGGRRELIIPPSLAYGSQGAGGVIKPNETLIFVIDLLSD